MSPAGYKHYSFDLWLTLIKSNPLFKKLRSQYFFEHYNFQNISFQETEQVFRQVDIMCNTINECTGKNIDADEMYLMVISLMNNNQVNLLDVDSDALYADMEELLLTHMPVVYCNNTIETLSNIKSQGATTNILSNTGFIKGITLRKVLLEISLSNYIDFYLFSDEEGMSKPNPKFFNLMISRAMELAVLTPADILHIGDNANADFLGAQRAGLNALLINSNQYSIVNLIHETQHIFPS